MGKRTTTRHKNENTFRYRGQKERQQAIVVNRLGSIRDWLRDDDDEEDEISFLYKAIVHWKDLNLYQEFTDTLNEIGTDVKSLAQVVHQKERITKILLSRISVTSAGFLEALYGLLTAVVSDLRLEFFQYLPETLQNITNVVLSTTDADIIALSFDCCSRLLKDCKTTVVKNFNQYFKIFLPLLRSSVKEYVVKNAAKSFTFVCSKVAKCNVNAFCKRIHKALDNPNENVEHGIALLCHEIIVVDWGSKNALDIKQLISFVEDIPGDSSKWETFILKLVDLFFTGKNSANKDFMVALCNQVEMTLTSEILQKRFVYCSRIVNIMWERLNQIDNLAPVVAVQERLGHALIRNKTLWESNASYRDELLKLICNASTISAFESLTKSLLQSLVPTLNLAQLQLIDGYFRTNCNNYSKLVPVFGNAYKQIHSSEDGEANHSFLLWYSDLIMDADGGVHIPDSIKASVYGYTGLSLPCYRFFNETRKRAVINYDIDIADVITSGGNQFLRKAIEDPKKLILDQDKYLRFFTVLQQVNLNTHADVRSSLIELLETIIGQEGRWEKTHGIVVYLILQALSFSNNFEQARGQHIENFLRNISETLVFSDVTDNSKFSVWSLKILDLMLFEMNRATNDGRDEFLKYYGIQCKEILGAVEDNLLSGFKMIRTLTLSILLGIYSIQTPDEEIVRFLSTAMENEFHELDLVNLSHLSNYLEMETSLKNLHSEDKIEAKLLITSLKYILGCQFHNHAKIMQTCRDTLAPIIISKLPASTFWDILSTRFVTLHNVTFVEPKTFVSLTEENSSDFTKTLTTKAFGFQGSEFSTLGQEVKIDYTRYKSNLWILINKLGLKLPNHAQDIIINCVYELHKQVLSRAPYVGIKEDAASKELISVLLPALEFLNVYPGKKGSSYNKRREISIALLMGNKVLNKVAVSILRKICPTIQTFLTTMEKIGDENWLKTIHLKSFSDSDAFFVPEDRQVFIDFIVRSLLTLKHEVKGNCMNYVISFLHGFKEEEVLRQVNFLFGGEKAWSDVSADLGLLKYMKGHVKSIERMVTDWRYQFPKVVLYLMELVCQFVDVANLDKSKPSGVVPTDTNTEHAVIQRRKAVLSLARSIVVNFFTLFEKLEIPESLVEKIFTSVIWSKDSQERVYSSDSISWYFQLMMTWSKIPRFHPLFIKCKEGHPETAVMNDLFDALESKFLKASPYSYLMEIVTNIGVNQDEDDGFDIEDATDKPLPAIVCGSTINLLEEGQTLGERILHHFKHRLLKVITSSDFFREKMFVGGKTEIYIEFLRLCAQFSSEVESNHKLCGTLIPLLRKFSQRPEDLIQLFQLIQELLNRSAPSNDVALKLSHCLCWTQEKGPREALCNTLVAAMLNKNHALLVSQLNAYTEKVGDTPDFGTIQSAFQKCTDLIRGSQGFKSVFFSFLSNTCFYYLNYESDIGILAATEGMLTAIAEKMNEYREDNEMKQAIRVFLDSVIIPRLKWSIRSKSDDIFQLHLKILSVFSENCHEFHGALRGTHEIFQGNNEDLLLDLQEMQLSIKLKAINRFQNLWPVMRKHPSSVVEFVIPIITHCLLDKNKLKVSLQNYIQNSLEALKWCVISLPHGTYFKYLESVMEAVPEDEQLLKQYHKLLGMVLDGYHFELDEKLLLELQSKKPVTGNKDEEIENEAMEVEEDYDGSVQVESKDVIVTKELETELSVTVKLNYEESKAMLKVVESKFIPKLRKYLHLEEKASHKLARASSGQDTLIKKIPTTLAYVKLLNKLPVAIRRSHSIWVIPTLCSSLNSRLISVRSNVRNTLMKIVEELGPDVFPEIVKSTRAYLVRGFQKHVRNFTLLHILKQLQEAFTLKPHCVPIGSMVSIIEDELFGFMSEDKDVKEILKNTPEAKAQNGLQLLLQCAKFANEESLPVLLKCPIERSKSAKNLDTLKIIKSWMTEVANGLAENASLSSTVLLKFLKSRLDTDCLATSTTPKDSEPNNQKYLEAPVDNFLLPGGKSSAPKQGVVGVVSAVSWFIYSCLYNILKRDRVEANDESLLLLDSFTQAIVGCENDVVLQVRTPTVRSLILMYQYPLKCFMNSNFVTTMWRKYFMSVNDAVSNEDINMYYKFLTSFFLTFTEFQLESNDFSLLIKCINRHIHENKCTGSALVLIRNILHRSLDSKDLKTLVREIKRRICSSDSVHVQEGCRAAYVVYVKNYLKTQEEFMAELYDFFKVLGYRKSLQDVHSVYKMIASLITIIPESWTSNISTSVGMDFILALMKSGDEGSQRLICDSCMKNLFERMTRQDGLKLVEELYKTCILPEMLPYQREICLAVSKMIEHAKNWNSESVASIALKILQSVLKPSNLIDLQSSCKKLQSTHRDFGIYEAIIASRRAVEHLVVSNIFSESISEQVQELMGWIRNDYIVYPHESIQDASVQFFNVQLSLALQLHEAKVQKPKIFDVTTYTTKETLLKVSKLYVRMGGNLELEELRQHVLLGINFLAQLACLQTDSTFHDDLVKALRFSVNTEVRKTPQITRSRETVYKFAVVYVEKVPDDFINMIHQNLMNITTRELTDKNKQDEPSGISDLCTAIQKKLEERLGRQAFIQSYEQSRAALQNKRDNNRAKKKEQAVLSMDPLSNVAFRPRKRKNKKPVNNKNFNKKKRRV